MGMRQLILVVWALLVLLTSGCKGGAESQKKAGHEVQKPAIEAAKEDSGMIGVIKRKVFDVNKSKPVGKAIDDYSFFIKREWQETDAKNGTIYVDFVGELDPKELAPGLKKDGVIARSVNIKFVVKSDGSYFVGMITLSDTTTDGKIYPVQLTNVDRVMKAIYANTELPLQ